MLNFGNKEFRNLQEQVEKNAEDIQRFNYGGAVLSEFGIRVIGRVNTENDLPDPALFEEEDIGDAYAVGLEDEPPYTLYVLTRPFIEGDPLQWFNIGRFPEPGPQGPQGPTGATGAQGERGNQIFVGSSVPAPSATYKVGDLYVMTPQQILYRYTGLAWESKGTIRGVQGEQGAQGEQGPIGLTGPTGPQGPQGEPGTSYIIMGQVGSVELLPDDLSQVPDGAAYLVGTTVPYTLYVISASTPRAWIDAGAFNDAYNVSVVSLSGASGTLSVDDYTTLSSSKVACIYLNSEDIFRLNNETGSVLVYNCVDRYGAGVNHPLEKYIIINRSTRVWTLTTEKIMIESDLESYATTTYVDTTKQQKLVSGTNIKTINGNSLLGSGDMTVVTDISGKQDVLVSGQNIKTINSTSILGQGNIAVQPILVGSGNGQNVRTVAGNSIVGTGDIPFKTINGVTLQGQGSINVQEPLVSGTNIKTINGNSLLGSGNMTVVTDISGKQDTLVSGQNIKTINSTSILGQGNIAVQVPLIDTGDNKNFKQLSFRRIYEGTVYQDTRSLFPSSGDPGDIQFASINGVSLLGNKDIKTSYGPDNKLSAAYISGLATVATSGSYNDLSNKPNIPTATSDLTNDSGFITTSALNGYALTADIPTKTSDLTNNSGFITSSSLTGLATETYVNTAISNINIPTAVSQLSNDSNFQTQSQVAGSINSALNGYATETYVDNAIAGIGNVFNIKGSVANVAALPASGNTIGDVYYVESEQAGFVWIEINGTPQWEELGPSIDLSTYALKSELPTKTSDLTNDSGFITSSALNPYALTADLPTKTSDLTNDSGFITSSSLTGLATETYVNTAISNINIPTTTSDLTNDSGYITTSALSGYALAANIPTKTSDLTNDSGFITSSALSGYTLSSSLATVATSGSYNDLTDKPTIPTVSYPVTDVQVGGVSVLNGTVAEITLPNAAVWGNITGTLSNQTDLANALAAKQDALVYSATEPSNPVQGMIWLKPIE